jgi:hypothetical protein
MVNKSNIQSETQSIVTHILRDDIYDKYEYYNNFKYLMSTVVTS